MGNRWFGAFLFDLEILIGGIKNKKYRQLPAPYKIADVIENSATYCMDFFWGQDLQPGFEPTSHHGYLTEEAGLNHSAILPSKISADAGAI